MGELPHQGFEWVMPEDFGLELAIYFCRPSNHLEHQGPGVNGPAKDGM